MAPLKEELVGPLDGFQDQKTKEETFDASAGRASFKLKAKF